MTETFADMFEDSIKDAEMRPGKVILGQIVEVGKESVIVDAGLKSEAEIPIWQFKDMQGDIAIKVGDEIEVEIEALEDGHGRTRLSREKACRARAWEEIEKAFADQTVIEGVLTAHVKGGFTVSVQGIRAFLPGSLYGVRPANDNDEEFELEKDPVELKVIKLDRSRNNVVVSRKAVLEKELTAQREALLESLEEGQVVEGVVKNLTEYGAFVNLGGIDGLLHVTDLAWRRVKHPSEVLNVGDEISVIVLKFDKERSRISLGMKQLTEDPWLQVQRLYKVGDRIKGKVTSIVDYGAFVEIQDGIKGLVHVTSMDWTSRTIAPSQVCSVGEEVEVMVLSIEPERHRISLGMKQCTPNPWVEFASKHEKGDRVTGEIKSLTDFGIFVSLENKIDGLVHINDIDWYRSGTEEIRKYSKGQKVDVVVLAIDAEKERISLGIKQISEDPYMQYVDKTGKGAVVEGTVAEVDDKGVVVKLEEGVSGYIRESELAKESTKDMRKQFEAGQPVEAKILSIDRKTRKIYLSVKALEIESEGEDIEKFSESSAPKARTLGEKLKEKLKGASTGSS